MDKTLVSREMTEDEILAIEEQDKKEIERLRATMTPEELAKSDALVEMFMKAAFK